MRQIDGDLHDRADRSNRPADSMHRQRFSSAIPGLGRFAHLIGAKAVHDQRGEFLRITRASRSLVTGDLACSLGMASRTIHPRRIGA